MTTVKKRCIGAFTVLAAVLSLTACDPATPASTPSTPSASASAGAGAGATVSSSPTPTSSPSPSATPSAAATTTPPPPAPTTEAPTKAAPAPAPPAPTRTRTQAPPPEPTQASTDCYPRSNAGNCYKAGQICRKADVGTSGRDANGRTIHCRLDSSVGQRWGY
ncbi:hypothetical protein ACFXD5_00645 [Streptomyces sp. NPDC059385]|uniref:hypothetical protein n=1 Tax=Streptomyces sp. NPDC059385 TaxID=3346817 RepID=UPI0036798E64